MGPKDPILGVTEAFLADQSKKKLNLGVGAYRDDNNKPVIIESVKEASRRIVDKNLNNEYAGIAGIPEFVTASVELAYGKDSAPLKSKSIAALQALSGTGALRLAGDYIKKFTYNASPIQTVYLPNPTWGNHNNIFSDSGLKLAFYKYYEPNTRGLDLKGLIADVKKAPRGSTFLFHACAHNPTGVDPKPHEWAEISRACKEMGHFVLIDSAYQGFASGDTNADALPIRQFVKDGHQIALAQSFSKNFGLYGHRVGCLSFITSNSDEASKVESQLKILARPMYSNPPIHGARIVSMILNDHQLAEQWKKDVKVMAERIITMRKLLKEALIGLGSKLKWDHVTEQIGMFCFSGLTPEQVDRLTNEYHIYLTRNGRISMAGVTSKDIPYLAEAIHSVTKGK
jgi:aspartate aminotransferase